MLIRHWKLLCHSGMPRSFVIRVLVFSAVGGLVLVCVFRALPLQTCRLINYLSLTMVYVVSDGGGTGADFIMASRTLLPRLLSCQLLIESCSASNIKLSIWDTGGASVTAHPTSVRLTRVIQDLIRAWMFWRPPRPMLVKPIQARNGSEATLE